MKDVTLETTLPHSDEAERAVLGAILLDNTALSLVSSTLKPGDFYAPYNRILFQQVLLLARQHRAIDLVTLDAELDHGGWLEAAGGTAYIASLTESVPRLSNVEHYARIVQTHSAQRAIIRFAHDLIQRAYGKEGIEGLLGKMTQTACELAQGIFTQENAITRFEAAWEIAKPFWR